MEPTRNSLLPPLIFNVFKPARAGSFDVVRHFKRCLPGDYGKIGHFGTLDPFACGVLLIGVGGAARLNDLVHAHWPKTYLAVGKLGVDTDTGDWQGSVRQADESRYLNEVIAAFDAPFIHRTLQDKFLGEYWQAPPAFSASKFQGKALHVWAREGVEIRKEPVRREVKRLEVVHWRFPYLSLRVTASSGTYVRTLFQEAAQALGTVGSLVALQREAVGPITHELALRPRQWPSRSEPLDAVIGKAMKPEELLPYPRWAIPAEREKAFQNGLGMRFEAPGNYAWGMGTDNTNWGLLERKGEEWRVAINFRAMSLADHAP